MVHELGSSAVKFLLVLFAIALTAHAAPSDPGTAAVDFLEKVRLRKLNLEPGGDTALSAQTAAAKKDQIARRLDRMARDLGSDPLEVGSVKLDENFAAVLVRQVGGFDPSRLQVFPVALVKRGAEWLVAPVPASFENAGAGSAIALRKRLDLLENWMLRQQVTDLEKLREQATDRMRQRIEASLSAKDLRMLTEEQVENGFLAACERRDLPAVLGYLGGLAARLPDDWPARLKAAESAFSTGSSPAHPWRLLTAPEVARALDPQDDRGRIYIETLDPAGLGGAGNAPRMDSIQLEIIKTPDGQWQINPPASFLSCLAETEENPETPPRLSAFPDVWAQSNPPQPQPTAELVIKAVMDGLRDAKLHKLLSQTRPDDDPETSNKACLELARLWWILHDPSSVRPTMPLSVNAGKSSAVALVQFFSVRDPELFDPQALYFEKSAAGWLWTPCPVAETEQAFRKWVDTELRRWPGEWQQTLLADSVVLAGSDELPAPTKDDARQVVESWLEAARTGLVETALPLTARLADPRSGSITLQNLGHEISGFRRSSGNPEITGIYQGEIWTAVGVKIEHAGKATHPLYPVVATGRGPRIVVEIDLSAAGTRGRDFLNRAAFERLESFGSVDLANELRRLFAEHQATVGPPAPK